MNEEPDPIDPDTLAGGPTGGPASRQPGTPEAPASPDLPPSPLSKADRYFQGAPLAGPELALRDQLPPIWRRRLLQYGTSVACLAIGLLMGLYLAPDTPRSAALKVHQLEEALMRREALVASLEQQMHGSTSLSEGKLKKADRMRHQREGRRYAASLRRTGAQGAGDLMEWFVQRWDQLLDAPQEDDRATRRAATLALLVGGMAANINPGDYVPWQAEFLGGQWLGELHFDLDGDGLPGKRADANRHDGFANVSVCQVAMALNQSMRDAQVLMMPELRCDRPEARMSVFLQGRTLNDALDEFVRAIKSQGFIALEKEQNGMRLVLVGMSPKASDAE